MGFSLADGISIRAPMMDDAQAIVDLINACSVAEGGAPDFTSDRLLEGWRDDTFALATDAWVAVAPDGQIVGYEEAHTDGNGASVELDGYVHPSFKGQGIGACLLRLAEARARVAITAWPASLRVMIESTNAAAQQLLAAEGFRPIRHFWRMEIALGASPAPVWPTGVAVRAFVSGQDERITHAAMEEAFADHWNYRPTPIGDWERALLRRAEFDPALWFLAVDGDEIAGMALCFDRFENGGWVRTLGVRPGWRRRGLGLALLYHAFGVFYARGQRMVGLAVDSRSLTGATRLYERAGLYVTERYDTCEKILSEIRDRSPPPNL
jgi:mycothiol synthase